MNQLEIGGFRKVLAVILAGVLSNPVALRPASAQDVEMEGLFD